MGTLICTLEMDKEKGLTIKVEDPDGKLTQTVTIDGKSITLEVKDDSDTSTVVQKPDSVTITCKAFTVEADTVKLKSKKESEWKSNDALKFESSLDLSFISSGKLTQKSKSDMALSSDAKVEVKATSKLAVEGQEAQFEAKGGDLQLEGVNLKMSGKAQAELAAPTIKVEAKGQLKLESSGVAELKGNMTTVSGSLVKLG